MTLVWPDASAIRELFFHPQFTTRISPHTAQTFICAPTSIPRWPRKPDPCRPYIISDCSCVGGCGSSRLTLHDIAAGKMSGQQERLQGSRPPAAFVPADRMFRVPTCCPDSSSAPSLLTCLFAVECMHVCRACDSFGARASFLSACVAVGKRQRPSTANEANSTTLSRTTTNRHKPVHMRISA